MKIHLKFNHQEKDTLLAIDCQYDNEQVNEKIFDIIERYTDNEYMEKVSQLSEMIHEELDYEIILFLATHSLLDKISTMHQRNMIDQLRDFLTKEEEEDDERF